ncbi:hypothetical protein O1611_g3451 [Lasiodiplodia mahajangana]|uniref:Uncharacterized protein n=1 Tax=Lasiodiplodia mahajangana TaxID=1108764 RepID=A0ACC2JRR0_9PEZI|nr:hypothetical protein O1611_g3451 [Lasiodiplodia mahajangana]
MSNKFGTSHSSNVVFGGHLANDDVNYSDFSDMVDWSNPGLDVLGEHLPEPPGHMRDSSLAHGDASADIHDIRNGYVSELDISNVEADGVPEQSSENDTINMNDPETLAMFTSLVLFANNPSAQRIELKACDYSHQATIQALAMKLNLHCSLGVSSTTVYLRKYSHEETIVGLGRQISSTFGVSPDPVQTNEAHNSFATHIPSSVRDNHDLDSIIRNGNLNDGNSRAFTKDSIFGGTEYTPLLPPAVPPPLPPPHYGLSSDHDSILSMPTSLESHSWRESFPVISRTLKAIGACWRCKILRKKVRRLLQSYLHPVDERSVTQMNLAKHVHEPRTNLGGKTLAASEEVSSLIVRMSAYALRSFKGVGKLNRDGFDRLESILDSADDSYLKVVLDILCSPIVEFDDVRRYGGRDLESNLLVIAWALVDSPAVKAILQVEHTDQTIEVLKAAITYDVEYGNSPIAALAIECLRNCVDLLRLHEAGYLTRALHAKCDPEQCRAEGFQDLNSSINAFIEEFSKLIFRKENRANERKWWLSAFYGLYIQSFVRRTIIFVEDQLLAYLRDNHPELRRACSDYLNLATELFEAASASYDPLISAWSLEKEPIDHKSDIRLIKYYRLAQDAVKTNIWAQKNVQSSFEFIALAFGQNLGSTRHQKNKSDLFSSLPVRPMLRRSSIESQTRRFSGGIVTESIYEDESSRRVSSPAIDATFLQKFNGKGPGRLRRSSGAKRRASSPPQSDSSLRRNDSSSSILNVTAMRRRGLSLASQNSPLSSPYLVAYDSTTSPRWNGSEDSLANLPQLLSPDSPAPRESHEFANSVSLRSPSLHNKSSNESFLEIPRFLNPLTKERSNMNAAFVVIDSRRRMRPSDIRIACMYVDEAGRVRSYSMPVTYMHSAGAQIRPAMKLLAATVELPSVNLARDMMGIYRLKGSGMLS